MELRFSSFRHDNFYQICKGFTFFTLLKHKHLHFGMFQFLIKFLIRCMKGKIPWSQLSIEELERDCAIWFPSTAACSKTGLNRTVNRVKYKRLHKAVNYKVKLNLIRPHSIWNKLESLKNKINPSFVNNQKVRLTSDRSTKARLCDIIYFQLPSSTESKRQELFIKFF